MNNSKLAIESISLELDEKVDTKPLHREQEEKLIRIIEAMQRIEQSKDWSTLKTEVFEGLVPTLEKELRDEAKKENPDALKLNRITGQLKWAEKYVDFSKLASIYRVELTRIRTMLYGKTDI